MEDVKKIKLDIPLVMKFSLTYNRAFDLFKKQQWLKAKETFLVAEKYLEQHDFEGSTKGAHFLASLYEMLSICDQKLKRPQDQNIQQHLANYKKRFRQVYIKEFIVAVLNSGVQYYKKSKTDFYAWYINPQKISFHETRIQRDYLLKKAELSEWPVIPRTFNAKSYLLCEKYVELYLKSIAMKEKPKWQHQRFESFLKAFSHLTVRVNYQIKSEFQSKALALLPRLNLSQQVKLLAVMGKYEDAESLIMRSRDNGNTNYFSTLKQLKEKSLSRVDLYKFEKKAYLSRNKNYWNRPSMVYSLYKDALDQRDFVFAEELILDLSKNKQRDETWQYSFDRGLEYMSIELKRRQGESLIALGLYRDLQKKLWKKKQSYCFISNIEKLVHEKILYLETVPQANHLPSLWKTEPRYTVNDYLPNGEKVTCLDHLNPEQKQIFNKIYAAIYFRRSLNSSRVMDNGGQEFIGKFGAKTIPLMITLLDNDKRTWRQEFIAETLLEKMAQPKYAGVLLEAFKRDFQYFEVALKAKPAKAAQILQVNAWVFGGDLLRVPLRILEHKLRQLYPEVYVQCLRLSSNYAQNLARVRKDLQNATIENKKEFRLVLRKALILHKAKEENSFHQTYRNSWHKQLFNRVKLMVYAY
ncbi:hypothetical protein LNTAR_18450 [Lentisphaera araneosa HTCC2155]|uniref:Uncharacterized protein n=2 Tax=Lentisphaera TaxID=256846 RepID=A6DNJ6_9BACT|nr:hypothetical protein LNTAR_18450 [Lentisphaera araneosa HTCC2155]